MLQSCRIGCRKRGCSFVAGAFAAKIAIGRLALDKPLANYQISENAARGYTAHARLPEKQPDFLLNLLEAFRSKPK